MHTRVPRFASQLRLGLFVFIITCPFYWHGNLVLAGSQPPKPSIYKLPRYSHVGIARWRHPALGQRRPRWFRQGNCLFARWKTPRGCKRHRHLDLRCRDGARTYLLNGGRPTLIRSVAYSPDGRILAGGARGGTIQFWEVENQRTVTRPTHIMPGLRGPAGMRSTPSRFRPTARTLASGDMG